MSKHTPGYETTPDGKVYSVDSNWRGQGKRELVQSLNSHGYPSVRLIINGKRRRLMVHQLVAYAHVGDRPSPLHEVRHIDGNKEHNHYTNLAWGTRKENADDRERHGKTSRGEKHSLAIKVSNQAEGTRAYRARAKGEMS